MMRKSEIRNPKLEKDGLVYVFTGEGKGKTSAAIGVAIRAALLEWQVAIVQWYKEKRWQIAEHKLGDKFENIKVYPMGSGFYHLPSDHATPKEHKDTAKKALLKAKELVGKVDLLVLDEICNTVQDKLLTEKEILELIEIRGKTHLILTGRASSHLTRSLLVKCDLMTECKKIKHPFDAGIPAVKGLDY